MTLLHKSFWLMATLHILAPTAGADDAMIAERPTFKKGVKFVFYNNKRQTFTSWTYLGMENGNHVFNREKAGNPDEKYVLTQDLAVVGFLRPDGWRKRFIPHSGMLQFPLKVGKKWKHSYRAERANGDYKNQTRECGVTKHEKNVKVKAGIWDAFVIECDNKWAQATRPAYENYMYAPAIGHVIKFASPEFNLDIELAEYHPGDRK